MMCRKLMNTKTRRVAVERQLKWRHLSSVERTSGPPLHLQQQQPINDFIILKQKEIKFTMQRVIFINKRPRFCSFQHFRYTNCSVNNKYYTRVYRRTTHSGILNTTSRSLRVNSSPVAAKTSNRTVNNSTT